MQKMRLLDVRVLLWHSCGARNSTYRREAVFTRLRICKQPYHQKNPEPKPASHHSHIGALYCASALRHLPVLEPLVPLDDRLL